MATTIRAYTREECGMADPRDGRGLSRQRAWEDAIAAAATTAGGPGDEIGRVSSHTRTSDKRPKKLTDTMAARLQKVLLEAINQAGVETTRGEVERAATMMVVSEHRRLRWTECDGFRHLHDLDEVATYSVIEHVRQVRSPGFKFRAGWLRLIPYSLVHRSRPRVGRASTATATLLSVPL